MKKILALTAILACGAAAADTIKATGGLNCGAYRVCLSVPNSAGVALAIDDSIYGSDVHVTIDGKTYTAVGAAAPTLSAVTAYADDGSYVVITAAFSYHSKLVRSGHNFYVHYWELASGSVVR